MAAMSPLLTLNSKAIEAHHKLCIAGQTDRRSLLSATRHCCHAITATATLRNSVAIETKGVTAL
jgi:hypothetical protein